jgi:glycerol-3-phosphate O-acyltransferase / dihydroxyacetone phosphate acyltransferase
MSFLATISEAARWCVRRSLRVYYPRIEIENRERLPAGGAVLFVANHPNSLMDPAVIGFTAQRPVHFFAKATLFDVPLFGALMNALGMVPAYRGADDKAQVRKNLETLDLGAKYLTRGEAVGIFPEGKTHDREGVEQVRTGAARIAWAAVQGGTKLVIVPLGLNYERKERFRSSIWVRVGEPIDAVAFFREYGAEERKALRSLTETIDQRLKQVVVHLNEARWQPLLHELEILLPPAGPEAEDAIAALRQRKRLADAMNYFQTTDLPRAEALALRLERHHSELAALGLRVDSPVLRLAGLALAGQLTWTTLGLLPGVLPALAGTLHHLVPFVLTRAVVRLIKHPGRATIALNRMLIGLPVYGLWYAAVWWLLATNTRHWIAWLWTGLMPLCGIAALHYARRLKMAGRAWWSELRLLAGRERLGQLRQEQTALREQLGQLRAEYLRATPNLVESGVEAPQSRR